MRNQAICDKCGWRKIWHRILGHWKYLYCPVKELSVYEEQSK